MSIEQTIDELKVIIDTGVLTQSEQDTVWDAIDYLTDHQDYDPQYDEGLDDESLQEDDD